ncbi:hypothetical protein ACOSP7_017551 [Xanthoceras sorbifolium]
MGLSVEYKPVCESKEVIFFFFFLCFFMRVLFCKIHCPSFICFCKPTSHIYTPGPLKLENSPHVPLTTTTPVVSLTDDDHQHHQQQQLVSGLDNEETTQVKEESVVVDSQKQQQQQKGEGEGEEQEGQDDNEETTQVKEESVVVDGQKQQQQQQQEGEGEEQEGQEGEGESEDCPGRSSLKKAVSDLKQAQKKKVQWMDFLGKELVEIREFETSEIEDSENDSEFSKGCICTIL